MATYCYCSVRPHPYVSALCGPGLDIFNRAIDPTKKWPKKDDADQENEIATQWA